MRGVLDSCSDVRPIYGALGPKYPEVNLGHLEGTGHPLYVLGPYQNQIGGCDLIKPYDTILELLEKYVPKGDIIFEGVLISDNYGRVGRWLERFGKHAVVAFLDTPFEVCLANVRARTAKAGTLHMERKFIEIRKQRQKMLDGGIFRVLDISTPTGADAILAVLRGG